MNQYEYFESKAKAKAKQLKDRYTSEVLLFEAEGRLTTGLQKRLTNLKSHDVLRKQINISFN